MLNFILIVFCVGVGVLLSRLKLLPADAYKSVNAWVLYVALPALALRFVPAIQWSTALLLPALGPLLVWGGAWVFVSAYDYRRRLLPASRTALFVICGLGNTAFLGFPMISAFYGEAAISHAVVFDQVTFIIFATIGVATVLRASSAKSSSGTANFLFIFKKILRFPPFIACMVALTLPRFADISAATPLLEKLIATMSPMALFSIGLQLRLGEIKREWRLLTVGIFYKLLLAPCLVLALALLMQSGGTLAKISVFEAGMSSHITASLLVSQSNLSPRYCSLVVGLGIVVGFFTSTLWYFVLQAVFSENCKNI
ncbi:MAG: AEC family transporter [Prevotellaceae bacterium]|jgi:predicted permease|nr:AEC family transporter [Prevotellaceae bacterium]